MIKSLDPTHTGKNINIISLSIIYNTTIWPQACEKILKAYQQNEVDTIFSIAISKFNFNLL